VLPTASHRDRQKPTATPEKTPYSVRNNYYMAIKWRERIIWCTLQ